MKLALVAAAWLLAAASAPSAQDQSGSPAGARLGAALDRADAMLGDDPQLGVAMAESALALADSLADDDARLTALNLIGAGQYQLGNYHAAMDYYRRMQREAERLGRDDRVADALNNVGILYFMWGEYSQALQHYLDALRMRERSGDRDGIAEAYNNLASVHHAAGEHHLALDYYERARDLYEKSGRRRSAASSLNNIGLLLHDMKDDDKALASFERALAMAKELDDVSGQTWSLNGIGMVYEERGESDAALARYREALALCERIGDRVGTSIARHNIGSVLSAQGEQEQALSNLEAALATMRELDVRQLERDCLLSLSEAVEKIGDDARALALYKEYKAVADELTDAERTRQMANAQTLYEVGLKDREIQVLRKDRELEQGRRNALLTGVILVVVVAFLLYQRYRFQKAAAEDIRNKNEALKLAHAEIEKAAREELAHVARVATMGELTATLAHELKQPLAAIQTNARAGVNLLNAAEPDRDELRDTFIDIAEGAGQARDIIQRLHDLMRKGELERMPVDLAAAVTDILRFSRGEATGLGVATAVDLAPDLSPRAGGPRPVAAGDPQPRPQRRRRNGGRRCEGNGDRRRATGRRRYRAGRRAGRGAAGRRCGVVGDVRTVLHHDAEPSRHGAGHLPLDRFRP